MKSFLVAVCALMVFSGAIFSAEVIFPKETPALSITFPQDWKVEVEDVLSATSADESCGVVILSVAADDFVAAMEGLAPELDKIVKNFETKQEWSQEPVDLNGFHAWLSEGTGEMDGDAVNVSVLLVVKEGSGIASLILSFSTDESEKVHAQAIESIVKSLKPAK
ncbi:hypothetical protein FACS1894139_07520 [Planctomycetales bacterium]|nr:hypothetical protein FACS1894107_14220 [Planctomycetales bacterium]GHT01384.1 hypothetical protein FACS1894108_15060 [Planctomycetales bacterium]GHT04797.1 hypothetical protein FACS1894139_07520 [Planctomycetales bacterium]GHV22983.1 hypothetical protein AGMMS49959_14810 [Planctomycetales bacterium]